MVVKSFIALRPAQYFTLLCDFGQIVTFNKVLVLN